MKDKSNVLIRGIDAFRQFQACGLRLTEGWNRDPGMGYSVVNDYISGDRENHPRLFILSHLNNTRIYMNNHFWTDDGKPDSKWSDFPYCVRQIVQTRAKKIRPKMARRPNKWGLTSYDGLPGYNKPWRKQSERRDYWRIR
jgi:hypothetical protein